MPRHASSRYFPIPRKIALVIFAATALILAYTTRAIAQEIYLPINNPDMITVLDANLLAGGQPPLITSIATGIWPAQVAVSPITAKHRGVPPVHKQPFENHRQVGFSHSLAE